MATYKTPQGGVIIVFSVLFAMLLMLLPLPETLRFVRPEWVIMVLIYWAMALPNRVGVGFAWVVGLLIDVMMGGTLGVLAFAYALVIYLVLGFHLQLRQYPLWQQALSIMSLVLLVHIIAVLISPRTASWHVWLPAVTSTIMWPFVYGTLRKLRRTLKVS
ncbi:MAG: rod shape-determining protein MreD [Gammaproteobacteria bacterium]|nr:rod shape-determining protein MreD [Gammaproteobacteria bacterium]MDH5592037.1 rod shape-determining protein MreD [Gammaproteobacteria bacterium]